ncbi:MAG: DUF615 domain-containing protein [Neisseriaceae bacterium]|nr:DUF615 domain-containing protein [Neisseriaceae bacterium]MBR1819836.1 DUF615 domain-containing protein [Neisseriaceae bacterium]
MDDIQPLSKTKIKKQMNDLQDLGLRLTQFASDTLRNAGLPENIIQAAADYRKITSNAALKRQAQYIGRLMREASEEEIDNINKYLAKIDGDNQQHNAQMKRIEIWRERLLADDSALTEYLNSHEHADSGEIRTLIRNARREAEHNKPPKSARALFKLLREYEES